MIRNILIFVILFLFSQISLAQTTEIQWTGQLQLNFDDPENPGAFYLEVVPDNDGYATIRSSTDIYLITDPDIEYDLSPFNPSLQALWMEEGYEGFRFDITHINIEASNVPNEFGCGDFWSITPNTSNPVIYIEAEAGVPIKLMKFTPLNGDSCPVGRGARLYDFSDGMPEYPDYDLGCPDLTLTVGANSGMDIGGNTNALTGILNGSTNPLVCDETTEDCITALQTENIKYSYNQNYVLSNNLNYEYKESEFTFNGSNSGLIFDIYKLDNSFDLVVNGESLVVDANGQAKDIEFQNQGSNLFRNIRFKDGDRYGTEIPNIWQLIGSSGAPIIRVVINSDNDISLFGRKSNESSTLHELELFSDSNQSSQLNEHIEWFKEQSNQVVLKQQYVDWTSITADLYSLEDVCEMSEYYSVYKTGEYIDENGDGITNPGDIIRYTITIENTGGKEIYNPYLIDELLGGTITESPTEDGNQDGILNSGETWTYQLDYIITASDIEAGGVYNQAQFFGHTSDGYLYPSKKSIDNSEAALDQNDENFDPNCPDCTFTPLTKEESCEVKVPLISDGEFKWLYHQGPVTGQPDLYKEGEVMGSNGGFIFDIYKLNKNFNITINNEKLFDDEIMLFNTASKSINTEFIEDGAQYGKDGMPNITSLSGNESNPLIRVRVYESGEVRLFGIRETNGELYELKMTTGEFNNIPWFSDQTNTVKVSQAVIGRTELDGFGYGVQKNCPEGVYRLTKTAVFNNELQEDYAQVGETITYTFEIENISNTEVKNLKLFDAKLGGYMNISPSGDTNNDGILDIDETWIYEVDYPITQNDIASGGVYNQAILRGETNLGLALTPVLSTPGDNEDNYSLDPNRPDHTFVKLPSSLDDCISWVKGDYIEYKTYGWKNPEPYKTNLMVRAGNDGYIFDFYKLDNSFNLIINGNKVFDNEVQFETSPYVTSNVQFLDGSKYQTSSISQIHSLEGNEENPLLRLTISRDGIISLQGARESFGELEPLELIGMNQNQFDWYNNNLNNIVITQELLFTTRLNVQGYAILNCQLEDIMPLDIEDQDNVGLSHKITLYPNPVEHNLYIESNSNIEEVSVYNMLGQKVRSERPNGKQTKIDMESLQPDIYLIRVQSEGKTETYRIVKR